MVQPSVRLSHGNSDLSAAADLRPIRFAGPLSGPAVRSAAGDPSAAVRLDSPVGRVLLSDCRSLHISVRPAAQRWTAPRLFAVGSAGRCCFVFLRVFAAAAAVVDFLDGCFGRAAAFGRFAHTANFKTFSKNRRTCKKPLLFCGKILYNKENLWERRP